jgi:hypothetical protein
MKKLSLVFLAVLLVCGTSSAKLQHGWKGVVHLSVVPLIEGTGIYSDVRILQTADHGGTKAGAITNLAFLGAQAGLGATIFLGSDNQPMGVRIAHRIVGAGVIASALWISIAGSLDKGVPNSAHYSAYAHTVFSAAPLILFSF